MKKAPLLEELLKYKEEENLILSMPGNKSGKAFLRDKLGERFKSSLGDLDITEVDPLDNLHAPEGVIKEAQELLRRTYKAKKAYFLVNGSTSGNLISIFSAFKEGDEVLVERNCHKSIYNALILRKLKVVYIDSDYNEALGIFMPIDENNIKIALKKANNPKGIVLTNPNYYGIVSNLEEIIKELKNNGLKVIIDSAHGAHFGFSESLPKSVVALGDYVVLSAHKTLPSLTQGGYLIVNEENENVEFYLKVFMTTSPSYLIMASLDYARYYLDNYAREDYEKLIKLSEEYKDKINKTKKVKILDLEYVNEDYEIDKSRYVIVLEDGYSGYKFLEYLRSKKIQAEMSFSKGVVLILSPSNTKEDFEKILKSIETLDINLLKEEKIEFTKRNLDSIKALEPFEVFDLKGRLISIEEALNEISKDFIVPYPPGIPLVVPGEVITKEAINIIKEYLNNDLSILGVSNNKVNVIKER